MTQTVTVQASRTDVRKDLRFYAGEALNFVIEDRPADAGVAVTLGEDSLAPPLVQGTGGDVVAFSPAVLGRLPEGRTCDYCVWLLREGAPELIRRGRISAMRSLAPADLAPPSIAGAFEVGGTLTLDPGGWAGLAALETGWTRDGAAIPGADGTSRLLEAADADAVVGAVVTGTLDGAPISGEAAGELVRWPAPEASGALPSVSATVGKAVSADLSGAFTGGGLSFALAPGSAALPAGLELGAEGLLAGVPEAAGLHALTVRAANSGGHAEAALALEVAEAAIAFTAGAAGPRLLVDGDSVMANNPGTRYLTEYALGDLLRTPEGYMQANGGEPASGILAGLPGVIDRIVPGETLVLMGPVGANQSLADDSLEEITGYLYSIYGDLLAAGAVVVAVPTLPDESAYGNDAEKDALAAWVRDHAEGRVNFHAVDIGAREDDPESPHFGGFDPAVSFDPVTMKDDQSHPNAAGAAFLAARIAQTVRPLVAGSLFDAVNLLGAEAAFPGARAANAPGVTGTIPANWTVTRTGAGADWTLSRNASGELVASIAGAGDPSVLTVALPGLAIGGAEGDVFDLLAEVAVDPASTGVRGVKVVGTGASQTPPNAAFAPPGETVFARTEGIPLAADRATVDVKVQLMVEAGATASFTLKRAALVFVENVLGVLSLSGTPSGAAQVGAAYGFVPEVSGGVAPWAFDLAAGALPAGLTLDAATGAVAGVPSAVELQAGIALRVTDAAGATAVLAPFTLQVVAAGAPVMSVAPAVDIAAPVVGQVVTADPGSWSGTPSGYAYQWLSSGSVMAGATGAAYQVQSADAGQRLSVRVVASNAFGAGAPARSAETGPVAVFSAVAAFDASYDLGGQVAYSDADRSVSATAEMSGGRHVLGAQALTGKVYFEIGAVAHVLFAGIATAGLGFTSGGANGVVKSAWSGTLLYHSGGPTNVGGTYGDGDVVQVAVDVDAGLMWVRANGAGDWNGDVGADPAGGTGGVDVSGMAGTLFAYVGLKNDPAAEAALHGSADRFGYAAPVGYGPIA